MNNSKFLAEQIEGIKKRLSEIPDEETPIKHLCMSFLTDAVETLSKLKKEHPQAYEIGEHLALQMTGLSISLAAIYESKIIESNSSGKSCEERNLLTEIRADIIRREAFIIWESQPEFTNEENRVGYTSKKIMELLKDRERKYPAGEKLFGNVTIPMIRKYIKRIAPKYARRHGARSKKDTTK